MLIQSGGTVIWENNQQIAGWKSQTMQEYSVKEAELLMMLKVIPNPSSISKNGRVFGLANWWGKPPHTTVSPMNDSLSGIIEKINIHVLPEIIEALKIIIQRRNQDADKLKHLGKSRGHDAYTNHLISALNFIETKWSTYVTSLRKDLATDDHAISPTKTLNLAVDPFVPNPYYPWELVFYDDNTVYWIDIENNQYIPAVFDYTTGLYTF